MSDKSQASAGNDESELSVADGALNQEPGTPLVESRIGSLLRKRFPLMMLVALAFWSLAGFISKLESVLYNAMLLDTYVQLAFLVAVNLVAVVFSIAALRLLNKRIPGYLLDLWFGNGEESWKVIQLLAATLLALITPLVVALGFNSEFPESGLSHGLASCLAIFAGLVLGWGFLMILGWMKYFLFGNIHTGIYFPFEFRPETTAVTNPTEFLGLKRADFQFLAYLFVLILVHWLAARSLSASEVWWSSAPSMVVILIWIVGLVLTGVANLFDRFRIPVIPILLVIVTLLQLPSSSDTTLKTVEDTTKSKFTKKINDLVNAENAYLKEKPADRKESRQELIKRETDPINDRIWTAIKSRMNRLKNDDERGRTLVVITCPGGGIHAASWAACVLERISTEYSDFADSVCVISSVSGGSVGTLYYVASQYHPNLVNDKNSDWPKAQFDVGAIAPRGIEVGSALDLATRSSLEPIAYGVVTDDLYGAVYSKLSKRDRGQRLEDSFELRLAEAQQEYSLGRWGDVAIDGQMPFVVFNATDAATGRRVLFDTVPTPRRPSEVGLSSRAINYRELLPPDRDIKPASAVRASATFPYISPFTRPDSASRLGNAIALCDGGYADNEGIVSAVTWLEFILKRWSDDLERANDNSESSEDDLEEVVPFKRILLLRIQPSPVEDQNEPPDEGGVWAWLRWMTGPAETMVNVRSTSQSERGNLETDLAKLSSLESRAESSADEESDPEAESGAPSLPTLKRSKQLGKFSQRAKTTFDAPVKQVRNIEVEQRNFQVQNLTEEGTREEWQKALDQFKEKLAEDESLWQFVPSKRPTGVFEEDGYTVIVETISFRNFEQVIPLNWKLTKDQKLWYLISWFRESRAESSIRKTLDKYFTRRDPESVE